MAFNRDSSLDISLEGGDWVGGASDGTTLWFVNNTFDVAEAYVAATQARDSAKDIDLGTGNWAGAICDGTTLWFVDNAADTAEAYVAATQARDSAKDIDLGTGNWVGGASDGTTLWFVDTTADTAEAYVAATRGRDSAKDIDLGTGFWQGAICDGTTLWFVDNTADQAFAYAVSDQSRQSSSDITHADLGGSLFGGAYAANILWFVEPTSNTAIAFRQTSDHAVDAGSVSFAFHLPQPTVTHTAPVLTLANIAVPAGRQLVGMASLIGVGASGDVYNTSDATIIDGADPPTLGASDLSPSRIYVTGNPQLRITNGGAGDIEAIFAADGTQEDYQIHVQTSATDVLAYDRMDIDRVRSTPARILLGTNNDPQDLLAPISALSDGDRVIFFLSEPTPVPEDHAVDAGAVSWAFHLPQPTVTHTPAAVTTDHAVDAGSVSWAFHLPQPAVTHTLAAGTTDHMVNAGAVAWAFHLPQPTVTHSLRAGVTTWLQYAITIATDPPSYFWTGRGVLMRGGNRFEGGGRAVGVGEIELVSGNPDRRLTITISSIPTTLRAKFLQDVGAVAVEVALIFSHDKGATWQSAPLTYNGRLSSPTMVNGRLTVELETLRGDVDHGEILYWSHEDQQRRFPGDKGFEYMRQLAGKGTETGWPP